MMNGHADKVASCTLPFSITLFPVGRCMKTPLQKRDDRSEKVDG